MSVATPLGSEEQGSFAGITVHCLSLIHILDLFLALDALDCIALSGTRAEGWYLDEARQATRYYHRTLQQELMKTIVSIIKMVGDKGYRTDLRNQASHELCRKIIDSGAIEFMSFECRKS